MSDEGNSEEEKIYFLCVNAAVKKKDHSSRRRSPSWFKVLGSDVRRTRSSEKKENGNEKSTKLFSVFLFSKKVSFSFETFRCDGQKSVHQSSGK